MSSANEIVEQLSQEVPETEAAPAEAPAKEEEVPASPKAQEQTGELATADSPLLFLVCIT
jgi:hypothetical protein